jgi:ribosome-associated protein
MHALQDLGEALVGLSSTRLRALALPEKLAEAVSEAQRLTQREARRRQLQYIGRLMREVDPAPIEGQLKRWREPGSADKARVLAAERWRERLLSEAGALDRLCVQVPRANRHRLAALVTRAAGERARGSPPHAHRALFRELNALLRTDE